MIARSDITGLVLAGGRGSRMGGVDKGLQNFRGTPMAMHVLLRLAPQVGALMVNANRNIGAYEAFGAPVFPDVLPDYAVQAMREALPVFGRKIRGYDMPDALLTGVETRTSAPLRITRGEDFQSLNTSGLYPAGEGAGYAGGILSAGVDGIKVAEAVGRAIAAG